jgi:hypothetical protein
LSSSLDLHHVNVTFFGKSFDHHGDEVDSFPFFTARRHGSVWMGAVTLSEARGGVNVGKATMPLPLMMWPVNRAMILRYVREQVGLPRAWAVE